MAGTAVKLGLGTAPLGGLYAEVQSGVLAGGSTFDYEPAPAAILKRRQALVVGARTPAEVAEDVRLLDHPVPDALWSELDALT